MSRESETKNLIKIKIVLLFFYSKYIDNKTESTIQLNRQQTKRTTKKTKGRCQKHPEGGGVGVKKTKVAPSHLVIPLL